MRIRLKSQEQESDEREGEIQDPKVVEVNKWNESEEGG